MTRPVDENVERIADLMERRIPSTPGEGLGALLATLWHLLVLVLMLVFVVPFRLVRWLLARRRRTTHRSTTPTRSEERPDVWREGY